MASPTEAEMNLQLQNAVALLDNELDQNSIIVDEDAYNQSIISDFAPAQSAGARFMRSRVSSALGAVTAVLSPVLTAFAHHIVGTPERTAQRAIDRIYDFFIANNRTVQSRQITFGTPTAFTAGKGILRRLTVDENGFDLEAEFVETKTIRVIRDENTGSNRHEEIFEFRGDSAGVDTLDADDSGALRQDVKAKTSNDSILRNPSFSSFSIAGVFVAGLYDLVSGDTVTGWTLDDVTKFQLDQTTAGVAKPDGVVGDTTPTALTFKTPGVATQAFSVNRLQFDASVPSLVELWVRPAAGLTVGTLRVTWGSKSQDFDLTTPTAGIYNLIAIDQDSDLWPASFNAADANFVLEVLAGADDEVSVDEVFFGVLEAFDGTWWHLGGGLTKFLLDDEVTAADVFVGIDSKIQKWLWRGYARHLPHVPNATQVVASGGRTLTFASPDTVTASSGSFITDGYVVGMLLTVAGTASNNGAAPITVVTALVITITAGFSNEGPVSGGETLDATASLIDPP